ncbi:hypothetical protein AHF37_06579 [Paragonimus kellicotti]|nr:hypothetical protein AHF37_06579 [Paragonimus kellicotti]
MERDIITFVQNGTNLNAKSCTERREAFLAAGYTEYYKRQGKLSSNFNETIRSPSSSKRRNSTLKQMYQNSFPNFSKANDGSVILPDSVVSVQDKRSVSEDTPRQMDSNSMSRKSCSSGNSSLLFAHNPVFSSVDSPAQSNQSNENATRYDPPQNRLSVKERFTYSKGFGTLKRAISLTIRPKGPKSLGAELQSIMDKHYEMTGIRMLTSGHAHTSPSTWKARHDSTDVSTHAKAPFPKLGVRGKVFSIR